MQRCRGLVTITKVASDLKVANDCTIRLLASTPTTRTNLSFKPIRIYDPLKPKPTKPNVFVDGNKTKSENTFNSAMGEVMMTKTRKRIAVEGVRLVEEALNAKLILEKLFILKSLKDISPNLNHFLKTEESGTEKINGPEIHRIPAKLMQTWSSVTTPPGIIGIFKKPKSGDILLRSEKPEDNIPLTVICDNIREPGNLGSILRSAAGAGCAQVLLTKGCVDPWNMKVLRGACGAHFYVPILTDVSVDAIHTSILKSTDQDSKDVKKVALLVADSNIDDPRLSLPIRSHSQVNYPSYHHVYLVMGGETEGISKEIVQLVKDFGNFGLNTGVEPGRVRISLANNMDSLNAANAFGIIAFELHRQFRSDN